MHRLSVLCCGLGWAASAALVACDAPVAHDAAPPVVRGLDRGDGDGVYRVGAVEQLRVLFEAEGHVDVTWTADSGAIRARGSSATWIPDAAGLATVTVAVADRRSGATSSLDFELYVEPGATAAHEPSDAGGVEPVDMPASEALLAMVSTAATGPIDTSGQANGSVCDLAIDGTDTPHVVYRNDDHPGIWYATFTGGAWQTELVDGMGFDIGGLVGNAMAVAVDSAGRPHIAYRLDAPIRTVWYATQVAGEWVLEQASAGVVMPDSEVGLALDPTNGERPVVSYEDAATDNPSFAFRTGADAWTSQTFATSYWREVGGGLAVDSAGTVWLQYEGQVVSWTAGSGFGPWETTGVGAGIASMVLDDAGRPLVLGGGFGLAHRIGTDDWVGSRVEEGSFGSYDLAWAGGQPYIALRHGSRLELVTPGARDYWVYTELADADATRIGLAVDSSAAAHVCYRTAGTLHFH